MKLGAKDTFFSSKSTLNIRGNMVSMQSPLVMGILNVTPDSFFDGGKYLSEERVMERARQMAFDGAKIIDIGGYSSRPGAHDISIEEEVDRIIPHIINIRAELPEIYISIDTFRSKVAENAMKAGADIINDISGGEMDEKMFSFVTEINVPYILMHMLGTPKTMASHNKYDNLLKEMLGYFQKKISILKSKGLKDIILDPGFGFAKSIDQNYEILRNLMYFKALELPLLVGVSRKSMIYKQLQVDPNQALNGSVVLNVYSLLQGVHLLRVHDVKETVEAINLLNKVAEN